MKVINLSNYKSEQTFLIPMEIINNKIILNMSDFYLQNNIYLEYDMENKIMDPVIVHQDVNNGVIKVIKSGISDNYLYHAILEKNTEEYDIIGIYKLSIENMAVIKVYDLRLNKSESYKNFSDFSNAFVYVVEIGMNQILIRCSNNNEPDRKITYYSKDLKTNSIKEIDSRFTSNDMRYCGVVKDKNGKYYVFRTGNFGSVEDRIYAISSGHKFEYVKDRIVVVKTSDFELPDLYNDGNYILIDSANENQGIDTAWVIKNEIHYFKQNILNDKLEHFVFDFGKKDKFTKQSELESSFPIIDNDRNFYLKDNNGLSEVFNEDEKLIFSINTSAYNEYIEAVFSNYVLVGSYDNANFKKIYEIETRKCVGEYSGNIFKYFEKHDTLVIC